MSVKLMGQVYDSDLPRNEKNILLAYADHADHDGNNIYPSVDRIAWKTGYDPRMVQKITKLLTKKGVLARDGVGPNGTNRYRIDAQKLPARPSYEESRGWQNDTPLDSLGGDKTPPPPGKMTPPPWQNDTLGGGKMTPNPSCKPSIKPIKEEDINSSLSCSEIWQKTQTVLSGQTTKATYEQVIRLCEARPNRNGTFVLAAPERNRDFIQARLSKVIVKALNQFATVDHLEVINL